MSDSYKDPHQQEKQFENSRDGARGGYRAGRSQGNREYGGFRIRLSDNEMRSARALQEAFNLRSTVAVLGFALRTLGQMLEEGKINDLIAAHQNQPSKGGERRENSGKYSSKRNNFDETSNKTNARPNPFARPEKPKASSEKEVVDSKTTNDSLNETNQESNKKDIVSDLENVSNKESGNSEEISLPSIES